MKPQKPLVLCIDQEQLCLSVRGLVLQSADYEVVSAGSAEDALRLAATRDVDVIVCGQDLGKTRGSDLATALKEVRPNTPILLITGVMEAVPQTLAVDAIMTKIDGPEALLLNVGALLAHTHRNSRAG
jgi:DNA-binding NtrC family response regulator